MCVHAMVPCIHQRTASMVLVLSCLYLGPGDQGSGDQPDVRVVKQVLYERSLLSGPRFPFSWFNVFI